ncbi:MAG: hypothetical protein FJY95_16940 [Candidatus Handelsmanbacteria bacterium]|nr:hypothetical protein [Candidatus Handelsmanbacteria bacterium]
MPKAAWFLGAYLTDPGFRAYRMQALRELLEKTEVDGVWMDYLHWHAPFEDPYPIFVKTRFNNSCLQAFEAWSGLKVKGRTAPQQSQWIFMHAARQWEDWRVSVLVDWAREIRQLVKELRRKALVGNYEVAWKDKDLGGVRRRWMGLDFNALLPYVDVFSPVIYYGRSGKTPEYGKEYVEYFGAHYPIQTEPGKYPRLWLIAQAHNEPRISPAEFGRVLAFGLGAKSTGVMMFTIGSVAADQGKIAAVKKVYWKKVGN